MLNASQLEEALKKISEGVELINSDFDPYELCRQLNNAQLEAKSVKDDLEALIDTLEEIAG